MSINQDLLWDIIRMGETSELFICEGDQIVAAQDETLIREDISSAEHEGRRILERYNEETGWTLYNFYSVEDYNQAILGQMAMGIVYTAGIMLFIMLLLFFITNPILQQINELADGMNQMEEGNLSIQVKQTAHLPREGVQIVKGFNSMVKKLEAMVDQVCLLYTSRCV